MPSIGYHLLRFAALRPPLSAVMSRLAPRHATIFTLHRFAGEQTSGAGHHPAAIRETLAYLRRQRFALVTVDAIVEAAAEGRPTARMVAFSVDDGYADFASVGQPLFAEFDCPLTLFVTTGPVDGTCWFWWNQVEYVLAHATRRACRVEVDGHVLEASWDHAGRAAAADRIAERLKLAPDATLRALIDALAADLEVALPRTAPPAYRSMTWDEVRACERAGARIGAHTVTHPILARCDADAARREVLDSVARVRAECAAPSRVFAYPNGRPGIDFGDREAAALTEAGVDAAVSTSSGHLDGAQVAIGATRHRFADARYRLPRFSFADDASRVARTLTGLDALIGAMR